MLKIYKIIKVELKKLWREYEIAEQLYIEGYTSNFDVKNYSKK